MGKHLCEVIEQEQADRIVAIPKAEFIPGGGDVAYRGDFVSMESDSDGYTEIKVVFPHHVGIMFAFQLGRMIIADVVFEDVAGFTVRDVGERQFEIIFRGLVTVRPLNQSERVVG